MKTAANLIGVCLLLLTGCSSSRYAADSISASMASGLRNEMLDATLWTETSTEYAGVTMGAYALAAKRLDEALADPTWSAALEQLEDGGFEGKPPAVILDVDETVLDNSPYQARLIEDDGQYQDSTFDAWVDERRAEAVPGSLEFTRYAASRGVAVIYVTNRNSPTEQATRDNLMALGFPLGADDDAMLTLGERPEWARSNKTPRRRYVSDRYRILLLIGDNFGDFSEASSGSVEEREAAAVRYTSFWGKKWIVLPNTMYGSWEASLYNFDYGANPVDKLKRKRAHLQTMRVQ